MVNILTIVPVTNPSLLNSSASPERVRSPARRAWAAQFRSFPGMAAAWESAIVAGRPYLPYFVRAAPRTGLVIQGFWPWTPSAMPAVEPVEVK